MAVVAALSLTSISAGSIDDDPLVMDLDVAESPLTVGGCDPPLSTMSNPDIGREVTDFRVTNGTWSATTDYVIFDVVVDEVKRQFWVAINRPPGSTASYAARYSSGVTMVEVRHCKNRPSGIVDGDQPILTVDETTLPQ
jgi:hypothetical protein